MREELRNTNTVVVFEDKQIHGDDLRDQYNLPCFYTKSKRGLKNAWEEVKKNWNENTRMYDVINILQNNKIKTHSYCAMD